MMIVKKFSAYVFTNFNEYDCKYPPHFRVDLPSNKPKTAESYHSYLKEQFMPIDLNFIEILKGTPKTLK